MGGGGESQNHYSGRLEDNGSSFLALCVCAHKEAVIERERERAKAEGREMEREGHESQGGLEQPLLTWERKLSPSFAGRAAEAHRCPSPTLLTQRT